MVNNQTPEKIFRKINEIVVTNCIEMGKGDSKLRPKHLKATMGADIALVGNEETKPGLTQENVESSSEENILQHPLYISLVMEKIFSFLDLQNIKQCRLVCTKWHDFSISRVEQLAVIPMGSPKKIFLQKKRSPETFDLLTEKSWVTFKSFRLKLLPKQGAIWPIQTVTKFLEDQKDVMKELTIENINIERDVKQAYFPLNPYVENLTHLAIDNARFIVSTDKLTSVPSLSFKKCALDIVKGVKLTPTKFRLNQKNIMAGGTLLVDEFLDFKNLQELDLEGHIVEVESDFLHGIIGLQRIRPPPPMLTLDLSGKKSLKRLSLETINVKNLDQSEWRIQKLKLRKINFAPERRSKMEITELDFGNAVIDLENIPESIEKLSLTELKQQIDPFQRDPVDSIITLPNLKQLEIFRSSSRRTYGYRGHSYRILSLFADCSNIETFKLDQETHNKHYEMADQQLEIRLIPQTTKNLFLTGNMRAVGQVMTLEKLVIRNNRPDNVEVTLRKLKCQHLVLDLNSKWISKYTQFAEIEKLILNLIKAPYKSLAIGSFKVSEPDFLDSSLSKYVDERAECYIFKHQQGKAISEEEFIKMTV